MLPDMYTISFYKALLNSFIHTHTNGYPVFNILYRHARGSVSIHRHIVPYVPKGHVVDTRIFKEVPTRGKLLRVSQIIAQMVQVVARMGYPVASLIIQKVNLVSVDDGEVPDGIIRIAVEGVGTQQVQVYIDNRLALSKTIRFG